MELADQIVRLQPSTRVLQVGAAAKVFCFSFEDDGEVTAGQTLSGPTISVTNGNPLVTLGAATVLTDDFEQLDPGGKVLGSVPAGEGVQASVTVAGATRGQCTVTCLAPASGGATLTRQVNFLVQ